MPVGDGREGQGLVIRRTLRVGLDRRGDLVGEVLTAGL
jgi:hypothetical protein